MKLIRIWHKLHEHRTASYRRVGASRIERCTCGLYRGQYLDIGRSAFREGTGLPLWSSDWFKSEVAASVAIINYTTDGSPLAAHAAGG